MLACESNSSLDSSTIFVSEPYPAAEQLVLLILQLLEPLPMQASQQLCRLSHHFLFMLVSEPCIATEKLVLVLLILLVRLPMQFTQ